MDGKRLTWEEIVDLEPELGELAAEAMAWRKARGRAANFKATLAFYKIFKPHLWALVGWDARNPGLRTCQAWDVACSHILWLLTHKPKAEPKAKQQVSRKTRAA